MVGQTSAAAFGEGKKSFAAVGRKGGKRGPSRWETYSVSRQNGPVPTGNLLSFVCQHDCRRGGGGKKATHYHLWRGEGKRLDW